MKSARVVGLLAVGLSLACGESGPVEPDGAARQRAFLDAIAGEWTGTLTETPALQKQVMRETPMRLLVSADAPPQVEYPLLDCRGVLRPPRGDAAPDRPGTQRFELRVEGANTARCQAGPVRLSRKGERLEFAFLGDTLRKIRATLERTP
jgi:hypothetical protein